MYFTHGRNLVAESVVDLNQFLPAGYTHAVATGIDQNGNVVGYAYNTPVTGLVVPPDAIAVVFAPGEMTKTVLLFTPSRTCVSSISRSDTVISPPNL